MKIFFSMRHQGALRNFSSTVRALAERGHYVHLSFMIADRYGDGRLLHELLDDYPNITYGELAKKTPYRFWLSLARGVRRWVDYLRYLEPEYKGAVKLRERAQLRIPRIVAGFSRLPLVNSRAGRRALGRLLILADRAIPTDRWIDEIIGTQDPDLVLVTPLVDLGSDQTDFVKSAQAMGIPSGLAVHSWDNLTNKGLIRLIPDRVFVWNEAQKREAVQMHGVPPDHVVITGAPVFDQWFDRRPSTTREEFSAKVGLPADRPYFLYLGSSAFIAPEESAFVMDWLRALRSAADPRVREASVLIRPHPENQPTWQRFDLSEFPNAVVWPRGGANPIDARSKNDFFDSIHHSVAAVGINTTAQIEAGIQGRPVYTIRSAANAGTQEGTLHFHYLLNEGGGLLHHAGTFDEHVLQLARALDRDEADRRRLRGFVEAFVRPFGLDRPATPLMADAVEALGRLGRRGPRPAPLARYPLRLALYPAAILQKIVALFSPRRGRKVKPLSLGGFLMRPVLWALEGILRWQPTRGFVKRFVVPRVMPRVSDPQTATEEMIAVPRIMDRLHHGTRPVIVGPWLSEVGFEVLYWIPFLNWVKTYRHFDLDRLVVVSRGGVGAWYREIGARYVDLFDYYSPEQYRERNAERMAEGKQKQHALSDFDQEILRRVRIDIEARDAEVLHPMYMYRLFYPYWKSQSSVNLIESFAAFRRMPAVDASALDGHVPDDFVAMRFYFNDSFPETEENRAFVADLVARLTETTDVVLLNPGVHLDDHWDLTPAATRRLHTCESLMSPRNNLDVQTKIISRARAFIGNYGGLSYLAPFYGVRSLAFYSNPDGFSVQHLELAHRVFSQIKRGSFVALDVQAVDLVNLAVGGLAAGRATGLVTEPAS